MSYWKHHESSLEAAAERGAWEAEQREEVKEMAATTVKYPEVHVRLVGEDGNAYAIMGRVSAALQRHLRDQGVERKEREAILEQYREESMSGDYDNLLRTAMRWVEVD